MREREREKEKERKRERERALVYANRMVIMSSFLRLFLLLFLSLLESILSSCMPLTALSITIGPHISILVADTSRLVASAALYSPSLDILPPG